MPASNTRECFSEFVGQEVIGVLFDACPPNRRDLAAPATLAGVRAPGHQEESLMTLQIEAREALVRMARYPSRDVYVRPTGHVYWPQPGEMPEPGEVWIAGGEHGAWTADDLERAMLAAAGVSR